MVRGLDREGFAVGLRRVGSIVIFGVIPVAVVLAVLVSTLRLSTFQYDFHGGLYDGARAMAHGRDPYRAGYLAQLAAMKHPTTVFAVPVYPTPALFSAIPLGLLPFKLAGVLYAVLSIAAMTLGLRLLGVTDWRCYGAAFLTWPLVHSLRLGQVNEILVLGLAIVWRWRDRVLAPAGAAAALLSGILFLWPIGVFLLITKRVRVLVLTAVIAVAATVVSWAVIGFAGLTSYPGMLSNLASIGGPTSVSVMSLGIGLGAPRVLSQAIGVVIALLLLGLAWHLAEQPDGERRAFGLTVVAALTASPLVWPHYFTLIFVPIAVLTPTIGWLWLTPLIAYLAPIAQTNGDVWKMLPYLAIEMVIVAALCLLHRPAGELEVAPAARRPVPAQAAVGSSVATRRGDA